MSEQTQQPKPPTLIEAAAVMCALVRYASRMGADRPLAEDLPSLLDQMIASAQKLRAVTK